MAGGYDTLLVRGETADALPVTVWSPEGTSRQDPLPLLLVQDGPEYDALASLTRYCAALIASGELPAHRVALLEPVQRNAWYSGSPQYLRTQMGAGLTRLRSDYGVDGPVAVMGASLGGLTALLAGLRAGGEVGAVFSQSGSFFQVVHDGRHESVAAFPHYRRIVQHVPGGPRHPAPRAPAADRPHLWAARGERPQQRLDGGRARPGRAPRDPRRGAGPAQLHRLARRARPASHRRLARLLAYARMRPCRAIALSCRCPGRTTVSA